MDIPVISRYRSIRSRTILAAFILGLAFGFVFCLMIFIGTTETNSIIINEDMLTRTLDDHPKDELYTEVKILCWIMTSPENHITKAVHVVKTWGRRCNKLLVMSSNASADLDVVVLPVQEGRLRLWDKTKHAFQYIYDHHLSDADWFLKADDDTYVIMENLRYFLYPYSPEFPVYFGHRFKVLPKSGYLEQGYMSGGAGYVLSKEAVKRLVEKALPDEELCTGSGRRRAEDLILGFCLANVNVTAGDSRDEMKRERFLPFDVKDHLFQPIQDDWYGRMIYYKLKSGFDCCSEYTISFHYQSPFDMYTLEALLYHVHAYGVNNRLRALPRRLSYAETETLVWNQDPVWNFTLMNSSKLVPVSDFHWKTQ